MKHITINEEVNCSHPEVDNIWCTGAQDPKSGNQLFTTHLTLKNGERKKFNDREDIHNTLESADKYLKSLK